MKKKDRKNDLEIDIYRLEDEWSNQPLLVQEYSEKLAKARKELEELENHLELVKAKVGKAVRTDPESYGIDRITVDAVNSEITMSKEYQSTLSEIVDKRYQVDLLKGMISALDNRKKALEKQVELFLTGYFSNPRLSSKSMEQEFQKRKTERTKNKINKGLNDVD